MTNTDYTLFNLLGNKTALLTCWTQKEIEKAIKATKIRFDDVAENKEIEGSYNPERYSNTPHLLIDNNKIITVTRYKWIDGVDYEGREKVEGYIISSQKNYQPKPCQLVFDYLIKKSFPDYVKYCWQASAYQLRDVDMEIYLKVDGGSVYVPIQAIINKDISLIEKRMESYWSWYYKTRPKDYKKQMDMLNTEEYLEFVNDLTKKDL